MVRMATLPQIHPLHEKIQWIEKHNVWRHKSALHHLIHSFKIKPSKIETIQTHSTKPNTLPPLTTRIASSKAKIIEELQELAGTTQVYTDRFCIEGQVGAAAVLYVNGRQVTTSCYHLGPGSEHTVF